MREKRSATPVAHLLKDLNKPELDWQNFDFHDREAVGRLRFKRGLSAERAGATLEALRLHQRLWRVCADETLAGALQARGLVSAHHIAAVTERQFAREHADLFGGDEQQARRMHRRAVQIKARVKHLAMNVRDLVASGHSRAMLAHNADPRLVDYFEGIPSYQALFGNLDFCQCDHCRSIFGPAAYFLDIMRITDQYITDPNKARIPEGFKLSERRPDLFELKLTCENSNRLVPFLQIVNEVLERKLTLDLGHDVYQELALATYPFNLPMQLPLEQIRLYLNRLGSPLATIYQSVLAKVPDALGFTSVDVAREYLGISPEEYTLFTTPDPSVAGVSRSYGYADVSQHLPVDGTGTLTFSKGAITAAGTGVDFTKLLQAGQQIRTGAQVRTVLIVAPAQITVDVAWSDAGTNAPYTVFQLDDLTALRTFEYRTSSSLDDLDSLFVQGLSNAELKAGVPDQFFINQTGQSLPYLQISWESGGDTENQVARIQGLSLARLDRVSRFVRLSRRLGIDHATLDWLMLATGSAEITQAFITALAGIKQAAELTGLTLEETAAFLYPMKNRGRGNGESPADLFDRIFNNAALLKGRSPYTAAAPIPFDPGRPLSWNVGETPDKPFAAGTAQGGSAQSVTLAAGSLSQADAYTGFSVAIRSGAGKGQQRIIQRYDAATKVATIYETWDTPPDNTSQYAITNSPDLVSRLAAALQVKQTDLLTVGSRLQQVLKPEARIVLNLENLTRLYRLTKLPTIYRLTIDEYFALLGLIFGPTPQANAGLEALQSIAATCVWRNQSGLSVYELLYILTGERSRYLRLPFRNEDIPPFVADLAKGARASYLTAAQLMGAGLDEAGAASAYGRLLAAGFINSVGVVLRNSTKYNPAADRFPITDTDFQAQGIITADESKLVFATLCVQRPALIDATKGKTEGTLGIDYSDDTDLDFLFVADAAADAKRQHVRKVLNARRRQIAFTLFAPIVPVLDTAFVTPDIDKLASQSVFNALTAASPPIIEAKAGAEFGPLAPDFTDKTPLDFLFVSKGTGQRRTIVSYDGATRVATLDAAWQTVPDAFSIYQVLRPENAGTAQGGAAATITLAADASEQSGYYMGMQVDVVAGTGAGQSRKVAAYSGADRVAAVAAGWQTPPDATSSYRITSLLTQGNARGGTEQTITLAAGAASEADAYKDLELALVADADQQLKCDEVRAALLGNQAQVNALAPVVTQAQALQVSTAAGGLADFLRSTAPLVTALLPYASKEYSLTGLLPDLISPTDAATVAPAVTALIDGLSRAGLMAAKFALTETELRAIARRPEFFAIAEPDHLTLAELQTLKAFKQFTADFQDSEDGLLRFFNIPQSQDCPNAKVEALHGVTGWESEQICQLIALLWPQDGQAGIGSMAGLLRLQAPFRLISSYGLDASYLHQIAALAPLTVGVPGQGIDAAAWDRYRTMASSTLAAVGAHYPEQEFAQISELLRGNVEALKRDGLVGYAIWRLQQTIPFIREPADVYKFLLIDVEMSGCDSTSYIAQGIGSVQLYMQRVRMGLEPGADTQDIREIWWTWMASYRIWEANRKVFLYPENYIEPSLRRQATPEFRRLIEKLLQEPVTDENVAKAYTNYFDDFAVLANLVHVGGYNAERVERDRRTETLYLVARTHTTPYRYYVRTFEKTSDCEIPTWSPWRDVNQTINADYVTPVYAFDRLFLMWAELSPTKSSTIVTETAATTSSKSQSVLSANLNYTFQSVSGDWVPAQTLVEALPIKVQFNDNPLVTKEYIQVAYDNGQLYWQQPYAQAIARGIPGTGGLSLTAGFNVATGVASQLERQLRPEDEIWVAGQRRRVVKVDRKSQQVVVDADWTVDATDAQFKVIPRDREMITFPPFQAAGRVRVTKDFNVVNGYDTNFMVEVAIGDGIQIQGETRTVVRIDPDQRLVVDGDWGFDTGVQGTGSVTVFEDLQNVSGRNTQFDQQFQPGDTIIVQGITRIVHKVNNATQLLVTESFTKDLTDVPFIVNSEIQYNVIPRTSGAERMLVVFGPNLEVGKIPDPNQTGHEANPGDDPFIASRNDFNLNLNAALGLGAKAGQQKLAGSVTGAVAMVLADDLTQQSLRMLVQDYDPSAVSAATPVQTRLARENQLLQVLPSRNMIYSAYWANDAPGTHVQAGANAGEARELLYHVNGQQASMYGIGNQIGWYLFNNSNQAFLVQSVLPDLNRMSEMAFVHHYSQPGTRGNMRIDFGPYSTSGTPYTEMKFRYTRLTTNTAQPLKQRLFAGGLPMLLTLESQRLPELPFSDFYKLPGSAPPSTLDTSKIPPSRLDFEGAYGPYFQEIFLHGPMLVADQLKTNQRFEDAKRWYEFIFNPTGKPQIDDLHPSDRYWRYLPFRTMTIPRLVEVLTNQCEINVFNDDPFDPDAIARLRISAYAKAVVMKYIDNLLQWGDALFSQDTREAIGQAANLYILASDLLGRRPVATGSCPAPAPRSFNEISADYPDGIPEFLIQLENTPFVTGDPDHMRFADVPFNEINAYFCIPENAEFIAYWDRVADRLFKIRHCMNIKGVERPLALFAPPLDPRALIQSFGSSAGGLGNAAYVPTPVPAYRFPYLVAQARNLVSDVIQLGSALLSALERRNAEALEVLRITQAAKLLNLTTMIKQQQIAQIDAQRDSLDQSLGGATERQTHYQQLVSNGLSPEEKAQIVTLGLAGIFNTVATGLKTSAAIGYAVPQAGSPFAMTYGGEQLGASLQEAAGAMEALAIGANVISQLMAISGSNNRRSQEWEFQQKLAESDVAMFKAQLKANDISKQIAQRELEIHNTQIAQTEQLDQFFQRKFTNVDLYNWMVARIATTYFQAYSIAQDLARLAQRAYQFENNTQADFITFGYWDSLHKGLTAGNGLMLALGQMEKSYIQQGSRPLEIQRTISLRQLSPLALLRFTQTGECIFDLPESLFDSDFPGHYQRKVKTLSVSIPAVVGPYQNIKATLTQTGNQVVLQPNVDTVRFLLGDGNAPTPTAEAMQSGVRNYEQIVLSTGQRDSGLFSVDLGDARYLPFEGTGVVSTWKLSMLPASNAFEFDSISDVIIDLQYTAVDGGRGFQQKVATLPELSNRTWARLTMAAQQDPTAWYAFLQGPPVNNQQTLRATLSPVTLAHVRDTAITGFYFKLQVAPGISTASRNPYITVQMGAADPVTVTLSGNNDFLYLFPSAIAAGDQASEAKISFNLANSFTPPALKRKGGENALNPDVFADISLVCFVQGTV